VTYLAILRTRRVTPLVTATVLSRIPVGVNPLAVVLFVFDRTGRFGAAGVVSGAIAVGMAGGQPFLGRLVDTHGKRIMILVAIGHLVSVAGLIGAGHGEASLLLLAAFAALMGLTLAPTTSVLRAGWPRLLEARPDLLVGAYAIDSALVPLTLMAGPLVVSLLVATLSVEVALVLSAVTALLGTVAFVAAAPADRQPRRGGGDLLGPLREPAIQTLVLGQIPIGVAFGSMQVVLPAYAEEQGGAAQAGLLLALFSLASILGALVYGVRPRQRPVQAVHLRLTVLAPLGFVPALGAWSISAMAVLTLPAGAVLSALFAVRTELAGLWAPAGSATEAVTWPLTALMGGTALGAAIAGVVVDGAGWRASIAVCVVVASLGAMMMWARRATLRFERAGAAATTTSRAAP
jgi:MFS family permease